MDGQPPPPRSEQEQAEQSRRKELGWERVRRESVLTPGGRAEHWRDALARGDGPIRVYYIVDMLSVDEASGRVLITYHSNTRGIRITRPLEEQDARPGEDAWRSFVKLDDGTLVQRFRMLADTRLGTLARAFLGRISG